MNEKPRHKFALPIALVAALSCGSKPETVSVAIHRDYPPFPAEISPSHAGAVNALFNAANENGDIFLWVYRASGTCPSLRTEAPGPLVLGAIPPKAGTYPKSGFLTCFILPTDSKLQVSDHCRDGSVTIAGVDPGGSLVGTFEFTFESGVRRRGTFLASHCPQGGR